MCIQQKVLEIAPEHGYKGGIPDEERVMSQQRLGFLDEESNVHTYHMGRI